MDQTTVRVLVVDDDVPTANALGRLLRAYGHSVEIAYGAVEALELAARLRPDLILQDIAMGSTDGYEIARRLRTMPALASTTLIACSGLVDEKKAREAGFDGWLVKPIGIGQLETVIATVLGRINRTAQNDSIAARHKQPK
jgi:CheY-like chemotaxis protein